MVDYVVAPLIILAALWGWSTVDRLYNRFAARHPEHGPFRKSGGCGGGCCSCHNGGCELPSVEQDPGQPAPPRPRS